MNNLIFSLNSTLPIFFVMMIGCFFRKREVISESFAKQMNSFVFKIALPVSLFMQLYDVAVEEVWDTRYVLFCFAATLASGGIAWFLSRWVKNPVYRGEFVQASFRSSASLLGIAYIEMIYGASSMGSLMMIGCVPLYNILAVIALSGGEEAGQKDRGTELKKTLVGIAKNPIIHGILIGFLWSLLKLPLPKVFATTGSYIGRLASPMGILAMGAMLDFSSVKKQIKPVIGAVFLKLVGFEAVFLPLAIRMGFRDEKLVAVMIMLGSASTVAGYVMAVNMGHEGSVSSGSVALSTLLASFSLTFWVWLMRSMGYI